MGTAPRRLRSSIKRHAETLTRLHQEDACQLLLRFPQDKYALPCSTISEALSVCAAPLPARARLLELVAFSYLICNGDLHAKNVSVLAGEAGLELAPAYDLVSTLPYGDRRMALQFEGRDDNFKRRDFINFGARNGVDASWLNTCRGSKKSASSPNASQISNARCASGSRNSPELR